MKPYKNLSSQNLGLLLNLARGVAALGVISLVLSLVMGVFLTVSVGVVGATSSLFFIPLSVSILFLSGLMAAVVAFEENYRIRTEYLVSDNKT